MRSCVLVGIVPANETGWQEIVQRTKEVTRTNTTEEENVIIEWSNSYSIVTDEDDDGRTTLLLAASTEAPPDAVVAAVADANGSLSCELWASAPAPLPLRPLDGYHQNVMFTSTVKSNDETSSEAVQAWNDERATETMREWGIVVQRNLLDTSIISELHVLVQDAIRDVEALLALCRPKIRVGQDDFLFCEIASRNKERFDLRIPSSSVAGEYIVQNVIPRVKSFAQQVLVGKDDDDDDDDEEGMDWDISVVYSRPGAGKQGWHADGGHQRGATDAGWTDDGWKTHLADPYAICLFLPLIDLNDEVGFTQFWPGSHRSRNLIGFGQVAEITHSTLDGKYRAGDGIWYDYRLLHQGMPNTSTTVVRPVMQIIFKKKWYVEKANYGVEPIAAKEK